MSLTRPSLRAGRAAARAALLLAGCAGAPSAHGREGNVLTPYATLSLTADNNLFRLPADTDPVAISGRSERGDLVRSAQIGMRGDRHFGRQRLTFDLSANQNRYRTYSYLDADLVNGSGTWAWQLGHDLSGEIGVDQVQSLTAFGDVRSAARNITTSRIDRATANYNLHPSWRLVGGVNETTQRNSSVERIGGNFKAESVEGGLTYMPVSGNHVTLRGRDTRASYPNRQFLFGASVSNDYTQNDLEADIYWQISGQSRLYALLARTRRHYPDLQQRDFNGLTGRTNWEWQASGKTLLNLGWRREIGAYQDITSNYIVTDAASLTATFQQSAKTQFQGRLENKTRRFLGDPGIVLASTDRRTDRINSAALTYNYDVAWPLRLSANLQRELRTSSAAGFNYADTSATLSMQLSW